MCPACIASVALTVAGLTSAGGLAALIATKTGTKQSAIGDEQKPDRKERSQ
jgi:hypothetical protein